MFMEKQSVKTMAEDDAFPSRESPLEPLPDLILHSSPSVVRRYRSVSISLPLEQFHHIGTSLRRLSDQFQMEREVPRNNCAPRRGTMDGTYHRPS